MTAPRCAEPMRRYEASNGPMLDDPICGRAANHPGPHRSEEAMARHRRAEADWWRTVGNQRRKTQHRTRRLHEQLAPVLEAAAAQAARRAAA